MLQAERTAFCRGETFNLLGVDARDFCSYSRNFPSDPQQRATLWIGLIKLTIIAFITSIWAEIFHLPLGLMFFFLI